jgi:hypothetical protein
MISLKVEVSLFVPSPEIEDRSRCRQLGEQNARTVLCISNKYCYVINYAPETGQPCYRLQIRNVQGYNEQVVASTRFTMRTTRNAD